MSHTVFQNAETKKKKTIPLTSEKITVYRKNNGAFPALTGKITAKSPVMTAIDFEKISKEAPMT